MGCRKENHPVIKGRLTDLITNKGIGGAEIVAAYTFETGVIFTSYTSKKILERTYTDSEGYFDFSKVDLDNRMRETSTFIYVSTISPSEIYEGKLAAEIDREHEEYYFDLYRVDKFDELGVEIIRSAVLDPGDTLQYKVYSKYLADKGVTEPLMQAELSASNVTSSFKTRSYNSGPVGWYYIEIYKKKNGIVETIKDSVEVKKQVPFYFPVQF
jgi:hypothetical protein